MTASISSCHFDKKQTDIGTLSVDPMKGGANGVTGSYKLRYIVKMSDTCGPLNVISQGQAIIAPNDPLPALWSTYSFQGDTDAHSYCKTLNVERDPTVSSQFYVTASYEPPEPGEIPDGGGTPINATTIPTDRKPKIWWDREVTTRIESVDAGGEAIRTYANTLYDDLIEYPRARAVMVAEFNLASVADFIDYSRKYDQAVNYSSWTCRGKTLPARTAMVREISGGKVKSEGSYTFVPIEMRFVFADLDKTWDSPMPEMSQTHFSKTGGSFDLDAGGFIKRTDAGSLVPLNTDGTRRDDTLGVLVSNKRVRREVDFNDLNTILNR